MAKSHDHKTNAVRALDAADLAYEFRVFGCGDHVPSGVEVAEALELDPDQVFKTLVTVGKTGEHYVFMIPVAEALDLKKAARAVGEKSIAMIKSKELLPLTGYVHGGCSPIGMKKTFTTVVDETAQLFDAIYFSAGKIGCQIRLSSEDLGKVIDLSYADLIA